jgi:hypothetical protein
MNKKGKILNTWTADERVSSKQLKSPSEFINTMQMI